MIILSLFAYILFFTLVAFILKGTRDQQLFALILVNILYQCRADCKAGAHTLPTFALSVFCQGNLFELWRIQKKLSSIPG